MNKYGGNIHDDKEYALKQLVCLRQDLSSITSEIDRKLNDVEKIICGLTKGHSWQLHEFVDNIYPFAKPPGVYKFKCTDCGEIIIFKACEKEKWGKYFYEVHKE